MKNNILFILGIIFCMISCSSDDSSDNIEAQKEETTEQKSSAEIVEKTYLVGDKKYHVDFYLNGGNIKPVEDKKDYAFVLEILDSPGSIIFLDGENSVQRIFKTQKDFDQFKEEKTLLNNNTKSRADDLMVDPGTGGGGGGGYYGGGNNSTGIVTLYSAANFKADQVAISRSMSELYSVDFNDHASSLKVQALPAGQHVILYEHHDFGGKRIVIEPNGYEVELACLCDFKIGNSGPHTIYIDGRYDGIDSSSGALCGWGCDSWNDEVTSIGVYTYNY